MSNEKKIPLQDLASIIAQQAGAERKFTEEFLRELVDVIGEYLERDGIVKVKGLGTFKLIWVEERKSVDVTTGVSIALPAHYKVSFAPDNDAKDAVNAPYAHLETVLVGASMKPSAPVVTEPVTVSEPVEIPAVTPVETPVETPVAEPANAAPIVETPVAPVAAPVVEPVAPVVEPEPVVAEPVAAPVVEPVTPEPEPAPAPEKKKKKCRWVWIVLLLLLIALGVAAYFTRAMWMPLFDKYFQGDKLEQLINESAAGVVDEVVEPEIIVEADSAVVEADTAAVVEENPYDAYESLDEDATPGQSYTVSETVESEVAGSDFRSKAPFSTYKFTVALDAKKKGTETVIDGSRLTMVAYRAYGRKEFWVYIFDANRDQLARPSDVEVGMELKIPALDQRLVDPNSQDAIDFALELAAKYK